MSDFELKEHERKLAAKIPRLSLSSHLSEHDLPTEKHLNPEGYAGLRRPMGVFITLKEKEKLRGCVGHIHPLGPVWKELRDVSILAATKDPRFETPNLDELKAIQISITLLSKPEYVDGPYEFEPGRHGIIFELGKHRSVFLPQVAPQWGWNKESTFRQLAKKAGLDPEAWKENEARFALFRGQIFDEAGALIPSEN